MPAGPETSYVDPVKPDPAAEQGAEPRDATEQLRDKRPKPRSKKKPPSVSGEKRPVQGAALKARSKVLERKLAELLTFPAVPATMVAPDAQTQAYMLEHFTRSGPRTAAALVEASESNPQLRQILERITAGGSLFTVVLALLAYAAPPLMWTLGMRQQAARITEATTMDEEQLAAMVAQANAAAQAESEAAQRAQDNGAPSSEAEARPDPLDGLDST